MNGYSSHTFTWVNAAGEAFYVKYHFKTDQGIENFTDAEAQAMKAEDADYHLRDLYATLARGEEASWTLEMQVMPVEEADDYRFNPFDLTKVWPHGDYEPIPIGRLVLNRNPENYFAEVEQAAFEPANMVPGIEASPDRMLLGRLFSYPDTHRHRIGTNYLQLPINRPHCPVHSYNKEGAMRYEHSGDQPVYAPNSFGWPQADPERYGEMFSPQVAGQMTRSPYKKHPEDDDYVQARALWRDVMDDAALENTVSNMVGHMSQGVDTEIQERALEHWRRVDEELGDRIAEGLGLPVRESAGAAS
jgi:catalase